MNHRQSCALRVVSRSGTGMHGMGMGFSTDLARSFRCSLQVTEDHVRYGVGSGPSRPSMRSKNRGRVLRTGCAKRNMSRDEYQGTDDDSG